MSRPRTVHLISLIVAAVLTVGGVMAQQVNQPSRRHISAGGFLPGSNMSSNMSDEPFTGSPLFLPVETYSSGGSQIPAVAVGDLNGDGNPDLIVANSCASCASGSFPTTDGVLGVLLGNGNGTFRPAVIYDSGGVAPTSVAIQDLNGDGRLDLAISNECNPTDCDYGTVTVLLGKGDSTFEPAMTYKSGGFERGPEDAVAPSIAIGDVNGDGKPDLVVTSECAGRNTGDAICPQGAVSVLLGNGDGTFQPAAVYSAGGDWTSSLALGDVNGDGKPDIVVANCGPQYGSGCGSGIVEILLNNGDGTFRTAGSYNSGGIGASSVALANLQGNGKLDILVANLCAGSNPACLGNGLAEGSVGVLSGNGDGTFQPAISYESGENGAHSVAVADVNGDGRLDLLVSGCNLHTGCGPAAVSVFLGNGSGTFQQPPTVFGAGTGASFFLPLAVADFNGDGRPDLAVGSASTVGVLLNDADR